jgi:5,10-methylenetetrahydromethanopterin reductase
MRDPSYIAQLAATLDELSDGRAEVVMGIGNIAMLEQYGVQWQGTRPIGRLREAHHVVRVLLDEGSISAEALRYAVEHFLAGAARAARPVAGLDLADSLLGAIGPDASAARQASRILAAFYIPSMPPALLARHGIDPEEVAPVNAAFTAGDIEAALDATPNELADRLVVAGTPDDWVDYLTGEFVPAGLNHALISFTDPFTLSRGPAVRSRGCPG